MTEPLACWIDESGRFIMPPAPSGPPPVTITQEFTGPLSLQVMRMFLAPSLYPVPFPGEDPAMPQPRPHDDNTPPWRWDSDPIDPALYDGRLTGRWPSGGIVFTSPTSGGPLQVLGTIDADGLRPEYTAGAPEEVPARADILDAIGDAITDAEQAPPPIMCACECGRAMPADTPSEFFATDTCQARWYDSQVTNPREVYTRPDYDSYSHPYGEHPTERVGSYSRARVTRPAPEPAESAPFRVLVVEPGCMPEQLAYRRGCSSCHSIATPRVWQTGLPQQTATDTIYDLTSECSHCDQPFEVAYLPSVQTTERGWSLQLHSNHSRTSGLVSRATAAVEEVAVRLWAWFERDLARFDRQFHARRAATGGADLADQLANFGHPRHGTYFPRPEPIRIATVTEAHRWARYAGGEL